jgi:excinuclease UvrABC helicase subunit UvrB
MTEDAAASALAEAMGVYFEKLPDHVAVLHGDSRRFDRGRIIGQLDKETFRVLAKVVLDATPSDYHEGFSEGYRAALSTRDKGK